MEAIRGVKPIHELATRFGAHRRPILPWKQQALEGLPEVVANHRGQKGKPEILEAALYQQIGRLPREVEGLKKSGDWPIEQRRRLIERGDPELSIRRQCELLGAPRSGLSRPAGIGQGERGGKISN